MNRSDVLKTYQSMARDVVAGAANIPLRMRIVLLATLRSAKTEQDVLEVLPTRFKSFSSALANGELPADRYSRLAFRCLATATIDDVVKARFISLFRQATGLYSRLTIGPSRTNLPWHPCSKDSDPNEVACAAFSRITKSRQRGETLPAMASLIAGALFSSFDPSALQNGSDDVPFRHGPGAVSEGLPKSQKGVVDRIDDPDFDWVYEGFFRELFPEEDVWYRGRYGHAHSIRGNAYSRMILVPKDYRGPRVIAAEPVLHQYVQQGLSRMLLKHIQKGPLSRCIDLTRAELNGDLARLASINGSHVTIDLKDASDSVRVWHIEELFFCVPYLRDLLLAARTKWCCFTGENYFRLSKITSFATMGSGLCFTAETIVFALIAIGATWRGTDSVTWSSLRKHIRDIGLRVYGDDILVARDYASCVIDALSTAGFIVNREKTCVTDYFKESCGTDCYRGQDVAPLRPRLLPGAPEVSLSGILSTAQNFYDRGYYSLSRHLMSYWFKHVQSHGGKPKLMVAIRGEQLSKAPGVLSVEEDDFILFSVLGAKVSKPKRLKTWTDRTRVLRVDDHLRLREALKGAPRDNEGFIIDTELQESVPGIKPIHVINRTGWSRCEVIRIESLREWYRLTKSWV